jgi:hypothetical protein
MPFMDNMSASTNRAFMRDSADSRVRVVDLLGQPGGHRPGYAIPTNEYRDYDYDTDDEGEAARQRYIQRMTEAWKTNAYAKQHRPRPGGTPPSTDSMDAYELYKYRLSNAWRTPTNDASDNAEGVSTTYDPPNDIAQLPLPQQNIYCAAYNKYMEENPDADEEECDAAGRAALANRDSNLDIADYEKLRATAQQRYAERISNAWRTR